MSHPTSTVRRDRTDSHPSRPSRTQPSSSDQLATVSPDGQLFSVAQVAAFIGLSPNAVYRAIWGGELQACKLRGRVRVLPSDIDAWIEANRVATQPHRPVDAPVPARLPSRSGPGQGLRELLPRE